MMNEWIISSSLLIAAVLAVRFALRGKISLRLQYALWAVVLLRLLLPVQLFTLDLGAGAVAERLDVAEPMRQVYLSANEDRYEQEYAAAYTQAVARYEDPAVIESTARELAQTNLELDLEQLLHRMWLAGMAVMAAVIIVCNIHLSIQLRRRRWTMEVPESLLPVYITQAVPTPCLFGFFRPAIYLTPEAAKDEQVRAHVLAHELTHYRHWDHVWSVLRSLCLVLHWYNPLVWAAAKVSRADAELACDEGALERLGESQRFDYGRTLIGLTCADRPGTFFVTATTMTGSLRERIKLLMKRPRNTALTVTALVLLVTLIVGCSFAGAPETTEPTEPPETETVDPGTNLSHTVLYYALPMAKAMEDYADQNPRELTEQELDEFRATFRTLLDDDTVNPAACFLVSYYDDISELDGGEFLAYFPGCVDATEAEFELLKAKYPEFFGDWTWETMPIPIHRYEASDIEAVVSHYGNIHWEELNEGVHYLEETGCYYNYTSDFGLGGFYAKEGFVYDGGAVVYSAFSALFLTDTLGNYTIAAHLPLILPPEVTNADGLLVYPGTEWGMTEEALIEALNIQEYSIFSGMRGISVQDTTFCGYPASIAFYFEQYRSTDEWGLTEVTVRFEDEAAANAVYDILYEQLGESNVWTSGVIACAWYSDATLEDLISPEACSTYRSMLSVYHPTDSIPASSIAWFVDGIQGQENTLTFSSGLHLARQIEASLADE